MSVGRRPAQTDSVIFFAYPPNVMVLAGSKVQFKDTMDCQQNQVDCSMDGLPTLIVQFLGLLRLRDSKSVNVIINQSCHQKSNAGDSRGWRVPP